jgi:hypothetical protein
MNPINLTLDMPIIGNCRNCCFPTQKKKKHKAETVKTDEKVKQVVKEKI